MSETAEVVKELEESVEVLRRALAEVIDVAIWMSGAAAFGPGGDAADGWPAQRERLFAAMEVQREFD